MTECWPRGNAQAEGFNKPLMKAIRSAVVEQRNWKQEMYQLLRQYRATPHTSTKFSPHRLLFGREPGTKLPRVSTEDNHDNRPVHAAARKNDKQAKHCQKTYADKRNKAEHNNLHVGDMVLMRNDKRSNKLSSVFSNKPMVVTDVRGTAVTAADDKHTIRRNTSRFKNALDPLPCFKEMGGGEIDVPTGAIVSSTLTVVVHTPEKSLCDAERDAVVPPHVVTTTPREIPVQRPQRSRCVPRRLDDYALN